ncbi:MAG: zinc-binding alcohol dehydrogenase, partial [Pseudomonadota bacterium]
MEPRALWYTAPGAARIAPAAPGAGEVLVETALTALSRGTERLVFAGRVPEGEHARMRAPFQEGDFPFPVKYGYSAVGRVVEGPAPLEGRDVFALHPHQDRFRLPVGAVIPLPPDVPARRAVLAANMETALNAVWDADPAPGTRVAVLGAGVVGALTAYLLKRLGGCDTLLADKLEARGRIADELGVSFACAASLRAAAPFQIIVNATASPAALADGLDALGFEGRLIELSWYGEGTVPVPLGGAFHANRLTIRASQVGHVAPARRASTSHRD